MSSEELKAFLSTPLALFMLMLVASLASALKQVHTANQNGAEATLKSYLAHWQSTLGTFLGNVIAFVVLIQTDQLNFASALGIGYGVNSVVDMLPKNDRAATVLGKQGGFARPFVLVLLLAIAAPALFMLPGCATNSPQTQLILETTTRMAVRRALAESDRTIEKTANIRAVAERLQGIVSAESTILGLRDEVLVEIDRLGLSPIDRADAVDLVNLFAAILQENYGDGLAGDERMVKVRAFLDIVLATLPAVSVE